MMARKTSMLFAVLCLHAMPAAAQSYSETASEIAKAIYSGTIRERDEISRILPELELSELEKLTNCTPELQAGGGATLLVIDWFCGENSVHQGLRRSTVMIFGESGELTGLSINRVAKEFVPTQKALEQAGVSPKHALLRKFGEAVVSGGDPTLGGLLNLDEFEQARLRRYVEGDFRIPRRRRNGQFVIHFFPSPGDFDFGGMAQFRYSDSGVLMGVDFMPYFVKSSRSAADYDRSFNATQSAKQNSERRSALPSQ